MPTASSRRRASTCITSPASTIFSTRTGSSIVDRYGRGTKGAGWYSFDANGVHFIGLVNVFDLKAGGMGNLGAEQLEWLEADLKGRSASTPIVVFAHIPLWTIYPEWGWGTDDSAPGAVLSQALRLGDGAQRPYPPGDAEGGRQRHFPHRPVDGVPATGAGQRSLAGADEGFPADKLRTMLGIANVTFKQNEQRLAIIDTPLQA